MRRRRAARCPRPREVSSPRGAPVRVWPSRRRRRNLILFLGPQPNSPVLFLLADGLLPAVAASPAHPEGHYCDPRAALSIHLSSLEGDRHSGRARASLPTSIGDTGDTGHVCTQCHIGGFLIYPMPHWV